MIPVILAVQLAHADPVAPAPDTQTVIYYNARLALREDSPSDAVKLWLLRNAVEEQTQQLSPHDHDFQTITWVALTDMGMCPNGLPPDSDGAGLWPIALHNWVVRNRESSKPARRDNPWGTFQFARQTRRVSINTVLGSEELHSLELQTGRCGRDSTVLQLANVPLFTDLSEPQKRLQLLVQLLDLARQTLSADVRGTAVVDARLFDLQLALIDQDAGDYAFSDDSEPARILRASTRWPVSEWMALSPARRRFLFDHAREYTQEHDALDIIALDIVDALAQDGSGQEAKLWIARCGPGVDRQQIWGGTRGEHLLAMDAETGFNERSALALHRGVWAVQVGQYDEAFRSFALALHHAHNSQNADDVHALALRWVSFLSAQFEITDDLLDTLQVIVATRDYEQILEDLIWAAALRADVDSFERGTDELTGHGAQGRRVAPLVPLASGDSSGFLTQMRTGLHASPRETMRYLTQFIERLELEDAQVRAVHTNLTLAPLHDLLQPFSEGEVRARHARNAAALQARIQAIIHGVGGDTASGRTRGPTPIVYAGSVRLAPTDPLPWPFYAAEVAAPSAMTPLQMTPEEWHQDNAIVFGWALSE